MESDSPQHTRISASSWTAGSVYDWKSVPLQSGCSLVH